MIQVKMVNGGQEAAVTFMVPAEETNGRMAVVGDFNEWDPTATPESPR